MEYRIMQTHIQKWGNSLGVRIPAKLSIQLHLRAGSAVDVVIENNQLVIHPKKHDLKHMLALITPNNLHQEMFDEESIGQEAW
jgi:antitoxin MazE